MTPDHPGVCCEARDSCFDLWAAGSLAPQGRQGVRGVSKLTVHVKEAHP